MNTLQHAGLGLIAAGLLLGGAAAWMLINDMGNPWVSIALIAVNAAMVGVSTTCWFIVRGRPR